MLWIRIGFNKVPDPAFYHNAEPDPDPDPNHYGSMRIRILVPKCRIFYMKIILQVQVGKRLKNIPTMVQKPFLEGKTQIYLKITTWPISMLLDPDPVPHCQYNSGSRTAKSMWIRIHNTGQENKKLGLRDCLINYNKETACEKDCKRWHSDY